MTQVKHYSQPTDVWIVGCGIDVVHPYKELMISTENIKVPIYVDDTEVGNLMSENNISFITESDMDSFINKLISTYIEDEKDDSLVVENLNKLIKKNYKNEEEESEIKDYLSSWIPEVEAYKISQFQGKLSVCYRSESKVSTQRVNFDEIIDFSETLSKLRRADEDFSFVIQLPHYSVAEDKVLLSYNR